MSRVNDASTGLNTVKVASNTIKINRANPNAISVRNSNSALDQRHSDELNFASYPTTTKPSYSSNHRDILA